MVRLKVLRDADLPAYLLRAGTTVEVDERLAAEWLAAGIVEPEKAKVERAVERKPREVRGKREADS